MGEAHFQNYIFRNLLCNIIHSVLLETRNSVFSSGDDKEVRSPQDET